MDRLIARAAAVLLVLFCLPAAASAQAAITGVVRDASGGVLPGVTVEAASPVLIEKVRSVVTDGTGQYRIVNLLPGTYSVTFALPGFATVKRDGIELTGTFVATVSVSLKVGALEETITVTGETPIVDVQSAKMQQTVSKDVIAAIPTSRTAAGIQVLIPGMNVTQAQATVGGGDSGGISGGMMGQAGTMHGGNTQGSRTQSDGLNTSWAGQAGGGGQTVNAAAAQEIVISTSGGLGEAEAGGVTLNVIPRDGGNTFSGTFAANGATGAMQGSNYTQSLKDQGLKAPSELLKLYDISGMGGGRIIRDRLWFYLTYREVVSENTVPGMFVNKNAGNPNAWATDFDLSRQAFRDTLDRNPIGRLTWQATPRNKFTAYWSEQYSVNSKEGGGTATQTIEATELRRYKPLHSQQATWSSPWSARVLLEAGFGTYEGRYGVIPRIDGTHNPLMIRVQEQGGSIPGLFFRMPANQNGGFNHNPLGTHSWRSSVSYVTGAHNVKVGYQGGWNNPEANEFYFGEVIAIRMNNGVINRLTQNAIYPGGYKAPYISKLVNFYAQDQWTVGNLTLQGGVRLDQVFGSSPDMRVGGPGYNLMPTEIVFPATSEGHYSWRDVTPRIGVAYNLFSSGKTALKFNLGKYMEGFSGAPSQGGLLSPIGRVATKTNRSWTDTNKDYVPNCNLLDPAKNGECGAMENQNFGKEVFTRHYDPNFISGWGNRPYNWSLGASVQQELFPRVSISVGYYRNSWGNQADLQNRPAKYDSFSIFAPADSRLPGGGGQTISGLYDLVPEKVGQVDELVQHAQNFAPVTENWQGVDVGVTARLRNGLTVQGGTSTGRRLIDGCALRDLVPEESFTSSNVSARMVSRQAQEFDVNSLTNPYCRVVEPYLTSATGLATYTILPVDVQVSMTWRSNPGPDLAANYVASNAVIAAGPQPLGRPLSGGAANVTVNLIPPATLYGDRRNTFDLRVAKLFRFGRTRTQIGFDVYNLMNTDVVTSYNQTFGGAWLTPTAIEPPRYVKISGQFDF